ncbi:nuclear transport factor 2 family protein [Rhodococcus sp. ARP2]|uniref:nuclear transport factor 2 family protein n=1 Tax=Rhodococcus sp. ARP2 TaxID=1661385 RepID=UPI00064BC0BD|nr:nuclear transport factor 2 family protein [Rhodococcus sp. ARP2]
MPDRAEIVSAVEDYVKCLGSHDVDGLVALFAPDAVQHEPLGGRTYRGIEEIREFDTANAQVDFTVSLLGPISVTGKYAAMQLRVQRVGMADFAASDLFEFDENGKIISLSVVLDPQALC